MKNIKSIAVSAVFFLIIFGLGLAHILLPDGALSYAERRKLAHAPELSAAAVFSDEYTQEMETYLLDQFPLRDGFRMLKAALKFYVFRQTDNNGVYLSGDGAFKMEYPLDEQQVLYGAEKLNSLREQIGTEANFYYSIIPDKNYFAAEATGHPHLDYERLVELMRKNAEGMEYVDIFPLLTLNDYYRTDAHWRQESIYPVAQALAEAMGAGGGFAAREAYTSHSLSPFYGVYCGQSALTLRPDELCYLTSELTESAAVTGIEFSGTRGVYDTELFSGMDGYDVFLSGAQAIVTVDCPGAGTGRELVIFRDSFGSSIAPYFIGAYDRITLVDLRYISSSLLREYVSFEGADVLFLYSTSILNSARLLK